MKEHRTPLALSLILFAVILPIAASRGGASFTGYLAFWCSVAVAVVLGLIGLRLLVRRPEW